MYAQILKINKSCEAKNMNYEIFCFFALEVP